VTILFVEICSPKICRWWRRFAGLRELGGLSSVRFTSLEVKSTMGPSDGILKVSAQLGISFGTLGASGFAEAHGGVAGINIPIGASRGGDRHERHGDEQGALHRRPAPGEADLGPTERLYPAPRSRLDPHLGAGAFNYLVSPLVNQLESFVKLFFNVDGQPHEILRLAAELGAFDPMGAVPRQHQQRRFDLLSPTA